jgi:transposase
VEDFWFIVAVRSEDEAEIRVRQSAGRTSTEGHPTPDPSAVFGGGEDPHRAGRTARRGEYLRALPPEGIAASMYYGWSKEFLEAGKRRLAGDTARAATSGEVKDLRRETSALKEVVADLTLENRLLKKSMNGPIGECFAFTCRVRDGEDEA